MAAARRRRQGSRPQAVRGGGSSNTMLEHEFDEWEWHPIRIHLSQHHRHIVSQFIRMRPDLDYPSVPHDSESFDDLVDDELFIQAQDQLEILAYLDFLNDCRLYHDSILLDEHARDLEYENLVYSTYDPDRPPTPEFEDSPPSRDASPYLFQDDSSHPFDESLPDLSFFDPEILERELAG